MDRRPCATSEEPQAIVEVAGDLVDRQGLGACRGQLDREWQPVELAADPSDGPQSLTVGRQATARRTPALHEQPY